MTVTSVADLLDRIVDLTDQVMAGPAGADRSQWETFDQTLYLVLTELALRGNTDLPASPRQLRPLQAVLRAHPGPLRPALTQDAYSISEAAVLLGVPRPTLRWRVLDGRLPAAKTAQGWRILAADLDVRRDIIWADSTDPRPLSRLSTTVGALNDLLITHREQPHHQPRPTRAEHQIAATLLAQATRVARHTVLYSDPVTALRAGQILEYADDALHTLQPETAAGRGHLDAITTHPSGLPANLNDQLEQAIHHWTRAARDELTRQVPSVDVLKNVTGQGQHLCATTHALLHHRAPPATTPTEADPARTRECAQSLRAAGKAWGPATTAQPATTVYLTHAGQLTETLATTITILQGNLDATPTGLDRDRALRALAGGVDALAELLRRIQPLPTQLLDSGLLYAPAATVTRTADRLPALLKGRHVTLTRHDLPDLPTLTYTAAFDATAFSRRLHEHIACRAEHGPQIGYVPSL